MNYHLELTVVSENPEQSLLRLTLYSDCEHSLSNWSLQFLFERRIKLASLTHGQIKQVGSFCTITPNNHEIDKNTPYYCEFIVLSPPLRFYDHGIKEALITNLNTNQTLPITLAPITLFNCHTKQANLTPPQAMSVGLIPQPDIIQHLEGDIHLPNPVHISMCTPMAEKALTWLEQEINAVFGIQSQNKEHSDIVFTLNPNLEDEHYKLVVDSGGIQLEANSPSGFVHASATLLQLIKDSHGIFAVPRVKIFDCPRFSYRGLMLDCARHFHSINVIKRLINQLAYYKFNYFHWHLTDDEGWRLEIDAFPQLTQIGAKRGPDSQLEPQLSHLTSIHEGYYTKQEVRDVIAYAAERSITVIPEIDIPGHCRAAIKSLPHLLHDSEDSSAYLSIQNYRDNTLSPSLDGTYVFIDKVLEEVALLFPSPWIHIGGDEVPNGVWKDSQACRHLMLENHYKSISELQGHILSYAENKLKMLGKRMLGWEEVRQGNKVSNDTVVFSWVNENAALASAEQGFDVVLQPAQTTYFDLVQSSNPDEPGSNWAGILTLEKTYHYQPIAQIPQYSPTFQRIWGIQCALWCEHIDDQAKIDYMLFPRLTALAEVCWTSEQQRNWPNYLARLKQHLLLMDKQKIQYRQPWHSDSE
ncbi:beta-N-acetylhexosaminidase [Vibrio zhanjiangensis]|uniref:beta-N-acetylhexosaminidase n=1 Tax=Vibrio zhanjiangensis TaxID=1046128 RepID=A0ABQ6F109_9VIBR|nr:beta-N-acetylhexosaminidase [Vibrio zhanjiangensis]GLT18455.1 beta-N-acetylhexosaminidase [Vibrio zhanjiangensis]